MNLDFARFGEFIRCLSIFKDLCSDVNIREGYIRQFSNDKTVIFEIDLTPMLGNLNIPISNLKEKLDLFKTFLGEAVTIENEATSFKFSDIYSSLTFKNPDNDFMENKFITRDYMEKTFQLQSEDLLISTTIIPTISNRIKSITQGFKINNIKITMKNEKAAITAITQSKDQFANFMSDIQIENDITCEANLPQVPFIIDHDGSMLFEMYKYSSDKVENRISTTISDINVTIYSRAHLIIDSVDGE